MMCEFLKIQLITGKITKEKLLRIVGKKITASQYNEITGEAYAS